MDYMFLFFCGKMVIVVIMVDDGDRKMDENGSGTWTTHDGEKRWLSIFGKLEKWSKQYQKS